MQPQYSEQFKRNAVQKYLTRGNRTISEIAQELGTTSFSIRYWAKSHSKGLNIVSKHQRSPEDLSSQEKLNAAFEYAALDEAERGQWLRKNGLTEEKIEAWKSMMQDGLEKQPGDREAAELKRKIKSLEKDVNRKDKALAEAAAILILQKKISEIYGLTDE